MWIFFAYYCKSSLQLHLWCWYLYTISEPSWLMTRAPRFAMEIDGTRNGGSVSAPSPRPLRNESNHVTRRPPKWPTILLVVHYMRLLHSYAGLADPNKKVHKGVLICAICWPVRCHGAGSDFARQIAPSCYGNGVIVMLNYQFCPQWYQLFGL